MSPGPLDAFTQSVGVTWIVPGAPRVTEPFLTNPDTTTAESTVITGTSSGVFLHTKRTPQPGSPGGDGGQYAEKRTPKPLNGTSCSEEKCVNGAGTGRSVIQNSGHAR